MTAKKENIDLQEVAKFNRLASSWWDPEGEMKPLHQLNPLRSDYVQKHAELTTGTKAIDVGCGGGILTETLAKTGADVTGIDMSAAALQVAKNHAKQSQLHINYQQIPIENFAATHQNQFDVVTCMELIEHVPDPVAIVAACAELAKPNGTVFFSTINRNLKSFFSAIVAAEYILNLLPKGTHHYEKFIRPSELTTWAARAHLKLGGIQGIRYQPFSGKFEQTHEVDVNYMAYFIKKKKYD